MTKQEALELVRSLCERISMPYDDHAKVQEALCVLGDKVKPCPI